MKLADLMRKDLKVGKLHTYHVLRYTLENIDKSSNPVVSVLAALFHDIGNKSCKLRKIVESEIEQSEDKETLRELAYAFRVEHMWQGILRTIEVLRELGFKEEVILQVVELVGKHDVWKIDDKHELKDELEALLVESDVMWMLTDDGIDRDRDRAVEMGVQPLNKDQQYRWNKKLISKILDKTKQFERRSNE